MWAVHMVMFCIKNWAVLSGWYGNNSYLTFMCTLHSSIQLQFETSIPNLYYKAKVIQGFVNPCFQNTQMDWFSFPFPANLRAKGLGTSTQKVNTLSKGTERGHWEPIWILRPLHSKVNPETKQAAEKSKQGVTRCWLRQFVSLLRLFGQPLQVAGNKPHKEDVSGPGLVSQKDSKLNKAPALI